MPIDDISDKIANDKPLTPDEKQEWRTWFRDTSAKIWGLFARTDGAGNIGNLAQINPDAGTLYKGELITPADTSTSLLPTDAGPDVFFDGSFVSAIGYVFNLVRYHVGSVKQGVLGWGGSENGDFVAAAGNFIINALGVFMKSAGITFFDLTKDRLLIGSNTSAAATTAFAIFFTAQTYNGESMEAGSVLFGSNSASYANVLWRPSTKQLQFRSQTTVQAYVDTTGAITAGAGAVIQNALGFKVNTPGVFFEYNNSTVGNGDIGVLEMIPAFGLAQVSIANVTAIAIDNPGFESGDTNWSLVSTAASSTDFAHSGTKSMKFPAGGVRSATTTNFFAITQLGGVVDFWIYSSGAFKFNASILTFDSGGAATGRGTANVLTQVYSNTGIWTRYVLYGNYPTGTTKIKLQFSIPGTSGTVYLDDILYYDGGGYMMAATVGSVYSYNFSGKSEFNDDVKFDGIATAVAAVNQFQGADIASASTTDIGAATGNRVDVTGTTTITALGTIQAGTQRIVRFTGILTLTHNATSLILPGAANITTVAGDFAQFTSKGGGNWECNWYTRSASVPVDGSPVAITPVIIGTTTPGAGTYTQNVGRYTKIGSRMIYFNMDIVWTAHTGTGNLRVDGLPFTAANNAINTAVSIQWSNLALSVGTNKLMAVIIPNTTQIEITEIAGGAATALAMDAAATLRISGAYFTT